MLQVVRNIQGSFENESVLNLKDQRLFDEKESSNKFREFIFLYLTTENKRCIFTVQKYLIIARQFKVFS